MDKFSASHNLDSVHVVDSQGPTLIAMCPEYGQFITIFPHPSRSPAANHVQNRIDLYRFQEN